MKRIDFARLADISPAMVTKYADAGYVVFRSADELDPLATLAALEGHLDEAKRQAALAALAGLSETPAAPVAPRSAKADLDAIKRDLAVIDLARKTGELIRVDEAARTAAAAVVAMRAAFDLELAATADRLVVELGLSTDRAGALRRTLKASFSRALTTFAQRLEQDVAPFADQVAAAE